MGLDMYLYKVKKIGKKKAKELDGMEEDEIYDMYDNIAIFHIPNSDDEEEEEEFNAMFADILPYCTKINVVSKYINIEQIKKDNGIPDDWYIGGRTMSPIEQSYTFCSFDGNRKSVKISMDDIEKKYIIVNNEEVYVVKKKEVGYWRKQYDLQDLLYEDYDGTIFNCGYHRVNEDMFDDIMQYKENLEKEIKEDDVLFYHEWY